MIQEIITHSCNQCGSEQVVRNGHDYKGSQKYHCKDCGKYGTVNAQRGYPPAVKEQVKQAVLERVSLRGIERLWQISRRTVARWLLVWWQTLPALQETLVPATQEDVLELDELWSFVGQKAEDWWLWVALCRRTRQIVAYCWGKRTWGSCVRLWERLPREYAWRHSVSDFWHTYALVFDHQRHRCVGKETGETAHVERWFNTLRQHLARLTRKTLAFSKSKVFHEAVTALFIKETGLIPRGLPRNCSI